MARNEFEDDPKVDVDKLQGGDQPVVPAKPTGGNVMVRLPGTVIASKNGRRHYRLHTDGSWRDATARVKRRERDQLRSKQSEG